jgi:hypothetical protein
MGARDPEVDAWFERYDNPMKEAVQRARPDLEAVVRAWCDARDASAP